MVRVEVFSEWSSSFSEKVDILDDATVEMAAKSGSDRAAVRMTNAQLGQRLTPYGRAYH